MLLHEVFNQPVQWKWEKKQQLEWYAVFQVGPIVYDFDAKRMFESENQPMNAWSILFGPQEEKDSQVRYKVLNTGNQQQVFATVVDILKDFIKTRDPNILVLDAEEENRNRLYNRMLRTLLPTWEITYDGEVIIAKKPGIS